MKLENDQSQLIKKNPEDRKIIINLKHKFIKYNFIIFLYIFNYNIITVFY